ncbi:GNAT family N-acetyltransferase [Chloroflexota bacterium]
MQSDSSTTIIRDLGDGLILRRVSKADAAALAAFNARVHSDDGPDKPDKRLAAWTRDLIEKPHPTFDVGDFTVVEDTRRGEIVSSLNLIPQVWSYAGIPFNVGRPELVGTAAEYRNRGLVRAQFDVIHQWSADRGQKVQAITGIPYYYRIFGYEMALDMGGGRIGYKPQVPQLAEGAQEPFQVRPAAEKDLAFIQEIYHKASQRFLVRCVWDEALWRYEMIEKSEQNVNRRELRVIHNKDGERVGFLAHPAVVWGSNMIAVAYELAENVPWGAVTPSVVRYLYRTGEAYAARENKSEKFAGFGFYTGIEHPVHQVLHNSLPKVQQPYAWYIRVPDLPDFIRHIGAALEERLAQSPYAGHSGELKISFYRSGLRLAFEDGRLSGVEPWQPAPKAHSGDAAFPGLTFLQLLFGYRSFAELNYAFADCWWENDAAYGIIDVLFPKAASDVWSIS